MSGVSSPARRYQYVILTSIYTVQLVGTYVCMEVNGRHTDGVQALRRGQYPWTDNTWAGQYPWTHCTVYTLESVLDHIYVFLDRTLSALLRTVRTRLLIRTLSHQNWHILLATFCSPPDSSDTFTNSEFGQFHMELGTRRDDVAKEWKSVRMASDTFWKRLGDTFKDII